MKHYRIVRIAGLHYDTPMIDLYKNNLGLAVCTYSEQQEKLFQNAYTYGDSFSRAMKVLGHDAHEIVYDLEILQKAWAKEKGIKYDESRWQYDIILKRIEDLRPDIVYFQDINSLPYSIRKDLRTRFPFIKLIVVFRGYPGTDGNTLEQLADSDVLLVGSPLIAEKCKTEGIRAHLVYHYFDESILAKIDANDPIVHNPRYDFTFIGSSGIGYGLGHQTRYWMLRELILRTNLKLWIDEREFGKMPFGMRAKGEARKILITFLVRLDKKILKQLETLRVTPEKLRNLINEIAKLQNQGDMEFDTDDSRMPKIPLRSLFSHRCHAPLFGLDMYRALHHSKVTFNKHSDAARYTVDNMRLFQATGVGTCLLTDTGKNMSDLFVPDSEVVTYSSTEECLEKLKYLLEHEEQRREIAAAGQRRTLRHHTVLNRCRQIDEILQEML